MNHDTDNLVALVAILVIFGAPMGVWMLSKIHAHTERMEMIRRGMAPPPPGVPRDLTPPGWGAMPPPNVAPGKRGYYPPQYEDYYYAQRQLRRGIQVACIGFALLLGLSTIGPLSGNPFGPWLLGGLIPMFVGIAQIFNAVLNGARLPGFGAATTWTQPTNFGPPPNAGPGPSAAAPPPQAPPGPYAWRPGSTPEIERPVPPPDQR
ncbi:MAG TPA: hypothetical protein VMB20_13510 [Candidatus Acidoferrum sp.]|nr:hypothetical protein [Candidatus Acidoferrum sp.]